MNRLAGREALAHVDEIKPTTSPQTTNATRWEVQLYAIARHCRDAGADRRCLLARQRPIDRTARLSQR